MKEGRKAKELPKEREKEGIRDKDTTILAKSHLGISIKMT